VILTDCHTHTLCSPDSQAPLEEMVRAAAAAGLGVLYTTDHCDLLGEDGSPTLDWDWTPVLEQLRRARKGCPSGLELRLGLELGSAPFFPETARSIVTSAPVDLVIASVHNMTPARGGEDFFYFPFDQEEQCRTVLEDYFDGLEAIVGIDGGLWDTLGHIVYPLRYINGRAGHHFTLDPWQDRLDGILRAVIAAGKAIEVNTHCGGEETLYAPILKRYRALGGRLVTLGSDAHAPRDVGGGIPQAARLLKECGFDRCTVFVRRTPEFIPL